jgi:hypothetical protein
MMGLAGKRGWFDGRFHANDGQVQALAQQLHGSSGGGCRQ